MNTADKCRYIMEWLDRSMIAIGIDATTDGVVLPPSLDDQIQVVLNLSYRFKVPMSMEANPVQMSADLSFGGSIFRCTIPFDAIFALKPGGDRSDEGWIDFDFVKAPVVAAAAAVVTPKPRPAWLKIVPPPADNEE